MADSLVAELLSVTSASISNLSATMDNTSYRNPDIRKWSLDDNPVESLSSNGYLMGIVLVFRNHILQDWELKYDNEKLLADGDNTVGKADEIDSKEVKSKDHIDEKSYRIPCPPTSGARFSSGGVLLLFGETTFANQAMTQNLSSSNLQASSSVKTLTPSSRKPIQDSDQHIHRVPSGTMSDLSYRYTGQPAASSVQTRSRNTSADSKDPVAGTIIPQTSLSIVTVYHLPQSLLYAKSYGESLIKKKMALEKMEESLLYDQAMSADTFTGNVRPDDSKSVLSYLSLASSRKLSCTPWK
jgi:hypothetical protein